MAESYVYFGVGDRSCSGLALFIYNCLQLGEDKGQKHWIASSGSVRLPLPICMTAVVCMIATFAVPTCLLDKLVVFIFEGSSN